VRFGFDAHNILFYFEKHARLVEGPRGGWLCASASDARPPPRCPEREEGGALANRDQPNAFA
jgi:hypothetical protein